MKIIRIFFLLGLHFRFQTGFKISSFKITLQILLHPFTEVRGTLHLETLTSDRFSLHLRKRKYSYSKTNRHHGCICLMTTYKEILCMGESATFPILICFLCWNNPLDSHGCFAGVRNYQNEQGK